MKKKVTRKIPLRFIVMALLFLSLIMASTSIYIIVNRNSVSCFMQGSYYGKRLIDTLYTAGEEYSGDKWEFWPKAHIIAGHPPAYTNSTSFLLYFNELLNREFRYTETLYNDFQEQNFDKGKSKWTILVEASSNTPECVPLLLSQNLDLPSVVRFITTQELHERSSIKVDRGFIFFQSRWYHLFGGGKYNRASQWNLSYQDVTNLPFKAEYLTPTGVVTVVFSTN